jgi:hypothetical protein
MIHAVRAGKGKGVVLGTGKKVISPKSSYLLASPHMNLDSNCFICVVQNTSNQISELVPELVLASTWQEQTLIL